MAIAFSQHASAESGLIGYSFQINHISYQIIRYLGRGGISEVYLGTTGDQSDDEMVFKFLGLGSRRLDAWSYKMVIQGNTYISQIDPEAKIFPYAPQLHFVNGEYVAVSKRAKTDLKKMIFEIEAGSNVFKVKYARRVLDDILPQLDKLNDFAFIHGDLKPSNIFISKDDRFTLGDFDTMARLGDPTLMYTKYFSAPEVERQTQPARITSDLYSLGKTLFSIFLPFEGVKDAKHVSRQDMENVLGIISDDIRLKNPEMFLQTKSLFDFILASTTEDVESRAREVQKTEFGKGFSKPILPEFSPAQKLRYILMQNSSRHYGPEFFVEQVTNTPNGLAILKDFVKSSDVVIEAMRVSQLLGLPIPDERARLNSFLGKNAVYSPNQMATLNTYFNHCGCFDLPIARLIFEKMVKPTLTLETIEDWLVSRLTSYKNQIDGFNEWVEQNHRRRLSNAARRRLSVLKEVRPDILSDLLATTPVMPGQMRKECIDFYVYPGK